MKRPIYSDQARQSQTRHHGRPHAAFTLLEVVAIIATLSILATVILLGVADAGPHTRTFHCMNNLRQLASGWQMYADENHGALVYNPKYWAPSSSNPAWVGGWLDYSSSSDNTNTDLLVNYQKYEYCAFLGPYVKSASLFKCPADKSVVPIFGKQFPRVRSVSMNNFIGTSAGSFRTLTRYQTYTRIGQVRSPSSLFVLLDEREDSINDGIFTTDPDTPFHLLDFPANYHDGAANLVFVDGHSEIHKWKDPRTVPPLQRGSHPATIIGPDNVDVDWINQHLTEPR